MTDSRITILDESTARRIAAGEVIDRPSAVLREFLDNSIDAEASDIEVHIEGGGITRIRVIDDGIGMSPEDLKKSILPHATSKIQTVEDLYSLSTLGFRGEALSSIAACSRLTIISKAKGQDSAFKLTSRGGKVESIGAAPGQDGTITEAADIFFSMPARRKFLKSATGESTACRYVFVDKALPFPSTSFRFFSGGSQKAFLPSGTLLQRVSAAFGSLGSMDTWRESQFDCAEGNATVVYQIPTMTRPDRRYMRIFINRRRIDDFSLIKSLEIAFSECMPGGRFPAALLFLSLPADMVDFNIHPAKREVRIKNIAEIRHVLRNRLREVLAEYRISVNATIFKPDTPSDSLWDDNRYSPPPEGRSGGTKNTEPPGGYSYRSGNNESILESRERNADWMAIIRDVRTSTRESQASHRQPYNETERDHLVYVGRFAELFIIVSQGDTLFLIDQHAAHERIIFDKICNKSSKPQTLLVPLTIEVEQDIDSILLGMREDFQKLGIQIEQMAEGHWQIPAIADRFNGFESQIVRFIQKEVANTVDIQKALFSDIACKSAIKDGDYIDDITALSIARETLALPEPRCPHGRPLWFSLTKGELFALVGRT